MKKYLIIATTLLVAFSSCKKEEVEIVADTIIGCMDAEATNYNASATEDDGNCIYPPAITGIWVAALQTLSGTQADTSMYESTYVVAYIMEISANDTYIYSDATTSDTGTYTFNNDIFEFTLDTITSTATVEGLDFDNLNLISEYVDATDSTITWTYNTHFHKNKN